MTENDARQQLYRFLQSNSRLSDAQIRAAIGQFRYRTLDADTYFVAADEPAPTLAYVADGIMRLFYIDHEGRDRTKSFCLPDQFVGAYSAAVTHENALFSIISETPCTVLTIPFTTLFALSERDPAWQALHLLLVQALYLRKERREAELLLDDATARYLKFREQYPGLEGQIRQYHIASYLGITPVALSRIRATLHLVNTG